LSSPLEETKKEKLLSLIIAFCNERQSKTTYYFILKSNKPLSQAIEINKNVLTHL